MKRIYIIVAAALLATGVQAQDNLNSNYLGFNLGGGLNSILYKPVDGVHSNGLGFGAGLQYAHFFGKHFGFGLGAQYATYNATAVYDSEIRGELTVHPDNGRQYIPIAKYNNWRERQTMNVLSIPLEIMYRTNLGEKCLLMLGVGAQYDMTVGANYAGDGSYETQGYFPSTNVTYNDLPEYGFSIYPNDRSGKIDVNKNGVSVIADLGVDYMLSNNWGLYVGLYGSYGLTNLYDTKDAANELLITVGNGDIEYNSTLASDRVDAYNLLGLGVKVGINFGWNCKHCVKGDDSKIPYASSADKAAAEKAAAEKKAAEEKAAAEKKAAEEKAAAEKKAAEEKAAVEKKAAEERAAAQKAAEEEAAAKIAAAEKAAAEEKSNQSKNDAAKPAEKDNKTNNTVAPMTQTDIANLLRYFEQISTGIHFDFNDSKPIVGNGVDLALRAVATAMSADKNLKVKCIGHTDSIGGEAYNQGLGLRRAKALKQLLVDYGAPARNVATESCGKNQPVAPNDTEENRAKNRRAVIELKK